MSLKPYAFCSIVLLGTLLILPSCNKIINTTGDPHFDENGYSIDSLKEYFTAAHPSTIKFYVEVSGSMNGFFRSNLATKFKEDVWSIISKFQCSDVNILSNDGKVDKVYPAPLFRNKMNKGDFVSNQETIVPTMLQTILDNLDYENEECAVLISDMKYSPEKQKDCEVLLTQYQTDIRNTFGKYRDISVCIILATSKYLDKKGNIIADKSPYYYVILGKDINVAFMRNYISTRLKDSGSDDVESIESGFNYKSPKYSFGIPDNAIQLGNEPTFTDYDINYSDTCTVKLKLDLCDLQWTLTNEKVLRDHIHVKSLYGSEVHIGNITTSTNLHKNKAATGEIEIKVNNMLATESDIIEWTLSHPYICISAYFNEILHAKSESDYSGSFSMDKFIEGLFNAHQNIWNEEPNRILISKRKQ